MKWTRIAPPSCCCCNRGGYLGALRRQSALPFSRHGAGRRSVDHSYVEYLVASGKITAEQALTHPNRNVLLASLGGQDDPKITLDETSDLAAGDAFVLCSDGLWAYFDDVELGVLVAQNSARQACEILIDKASRRQRGGDNLSLAIIKLIDACPARRHRVVPRRAWRGKKGAQGAIFV
jgi:serine/threonine protein phosphatase PrpC